MEQTGLLTKNVERQRKSPVTGDFRGSTLVVPRFRTSNWLQAGYQFK